MAKFITGAAGSASKRITSRFSKLSFVLTITGASTLAAVRAALAAMKLAVSRNTEKGTEYVIYSNTLQYLAEKAAHLEGPIKVYTSGADLKVKFTIDVVDVRSRGAIAASQDRTYDFDLTGIPAGTTVDVELMEFPGDAQRRYEYNKTTILADSPSGVDIANAKFLALKVSALVEMELVFGYGSSRQQIVYTPQVIEQMVNDFNHEIYNFNGSVTSGFDTLYCIDVEGANYAKITYNANDAVFVINQKAV
ncbi:MAG: hypothetical protein JWN76_1240 [Chitinophagaceae bacterium]|nr:hypothetical protein [Chitinophagaceae bacterium]